MVIISFMLKPFMKKGTLTMSKKLPVKHIVKNGVTLITIEDVMKAKESKDQGNLALVFKAFMEQLTSEMRARVDDIHIMNIIALENAQEHNSFTLMTCMVNSVTEMKAVRHARLKQWFIEHAPCKWEKGSFVFDNTREPTDYKIEEARQHPWHAEPEKLTINFYEVDNIYKAVETVISRAKGKNASPAQRKELQELVSFFEKTVKPRVEAIKEIASTKTLDIIIDVKADKDISEAA